MEIATPNRWKNLPMPPQVAEIEYRESFTRDEFERISRGLIPEEMEDKWFIYFDDGVLHFHRSWTGNCIYLVEIIQDGEQYSVRRATANRSPDQYRESDDAYDVQMLAFLIGNLLLGRQDPFPLPSNLPANSPRGLYQHVVAGTGFPERKTGRQKEENTEKETKRKPYQRVDVSGAHPGNKTERKPWWKFWK